MYKNLPWKHSKIRTWIGYRRVQFLHSFSDDEKRTELRNQLKNGRRILFVHVPKTGGVSFIKTYENHFLDARHCPVVRYKATLGRDYSQVVSFSIVRNPWARLLSAYNFLRKGGLGDMDAAMGKVLDRECPSFETFVKEWLPKKGVCCYGHFVPQFEFVCGIRGKVLVDHIIHLEQLADEFPRIATTMGLPVVELPHLNASGKTDYRDFYDDVTRDIIARLYCKDIALFGYRFGE